MKGHVDLGLSRRLNELRNDDSKRWNVRQVEMRILREMQRLGEEQSLSYQAIENAFKGKPISERTQRTLMKLINYETRGSAHLPLKDADLDLGRFFGSRTQDFRESGRAIHGDYQLYAKSNVLPNHLWRGSVSFRFDDDIEKPRIYVELEGYRPEIKSIGEKRYNSEGYAVPNGAQTYSIILRSTFEKGDEMSALCLAERMNLDHKGHVTKILVHSIQYELEKKSYMKSKWLLIRSDFNDICRDFINIDEFDDNIILEELCLMEEKNY